MQVKKMLAQPIDVFSVAFWNQIESEKYGKKSIAKNSKEYLTKEDYLNLFQMKTVSVGDKVSGTVVSVNSKEIVVDFDYKDYVHIDAKSTFELIDNLEINQNVDVLITEINEKSYMIKGSISDLIKKESLTKLKASYDLENPQPLLCHVNKITPSGYNVTIFIDGCQFKGFMPNYLAGVNRVFDQNELFDTNIYVMLETLDCDKDIYVVSRRKYLESMIPHAISLLKPNQIYTGRVTGCQKFGVFVEFNDCLTTMIPKDSLNPIYHEDLENCSIKDNTLIDFYIQEIIDDKRNINKKKIISTQFLKESIWDSIKVGDVYDDCMIIKCMENGFLVKVDTDLIGFVKHSNVKAEKKEYEKLDKVKVKVLSINRELLQTTLSIV